MGIKWKVCGLRDNIEEVVSLQPDYVGFIFYPKSPRYVGESFDMPAIDGRVKKVGVFVNESTEAVISKVKKYQLDFVQLHGEESAEVCKELRQEGIRIIKAFQVGTDFDFNLLEDYEPMVDHFLFDAQTKKFGGSGKVFDWTLLKNYQSEKTYFLSGGIGLDNIQEVPKIDLSKVYALDVNSRFENEPGRKEIEKLKEFRKKMNDLGL